MNFSVILWILKIKRLIYENLLGTGQIAALHSISLNSQVRRHCGCIKVICKTLWFRQVHYIHAVSLGDVISFT
ncbi:MAG: hypothetical protein EBZ75_03820 [Oxalobacteraceae bacterium]|nr:hypothetical protein [Oxalobacteraceae bacterium]